VAGAVAGAGAGARRWRTDDCLPNTLASARGEIQGMQQAPHGTTTMRMRMMATTTVATARPRGADGAKNKTEHWSALRKQISGER